MFQKEAEWIAAALARNERAAISPLINLGSSSGEFRAREQPWIEEAIFRPLAARGVSVVHCDVKQQPGVDLVADVLGESGRQRVADLRPRAILCSNLLEHVRDPKAMLAACLTLLPVGGLLVITVPRSYPYHRDPIDTMFRPAPEELAALMGDAAEVLESAVIETGSYRDQVRARPLILLRPLFRLPFPFLGFEKWRRSLGKLRWLVRPYRVTCLVARKAA